MKLEQLKKFDHGRLGIAYSVEGLTSSQYNDIYLQACEKYNSVEHHARLSLYADKMHGCILCKE